MRPDPFDSDITNANKPSESSDLAVPQPGFQQNLCWRCQARRPEWDETYCQFCRDQIASEQRRQWREEIWHAWFIASPFEGLLGLGVGAMAMFAFPDSSGQPAPPGALAVGLILVSIIALCVGGGHAVILRSTIWRWRLWAALDTCEVLVFWALLVTLAPQIGPLPGLAALVAAASGMLNASCQSLLLRSQMDGTARWIIGSGAAWCVAALAGGVVDTGLHHPVLSVVWSVAVVRFAYTALSGAFLTSLVGEELRVGGV